MSAAMRTMFKETKQKSVRRIKAGAGETRDAKERQNAEQTHKQTKGASRLLACGGGKKKRESPQKCAAVTREGARFASGRGAGGSRELVASFEHDLEVGTAASAADSSETKARCVGPDKIRGRAASGVSRQ